MYFHRGDAVAAAGTQKIDALGAGYHLLNRVCYKTLDEFGAGAGIGGGDRDDRGFEFGILAYLGIEKSLYSE